MFDYTQDNAQAREILRMVLVELNELDLPPTPLYYALFFERALRRDASLIKDLDDALNHSDGLTLERAQAIFDEHLLNGAIKEMTKAQNSMLRIIRNVMLQMLTTGNEFSNFAAGLGEFMRKVDRSDSIEAIRALTDEVIQDSQTVERNASQTSDRLTTASEEINRLKEELESARRDARTDPLTGLPNRRGFSDLIQAQLDQRSESRQDFCVILADVDHFKRINDAYGHLVGDKILRFVARTLQAHVKGQDSVVRYGGEEFAVVLPQTGYQGGLAVANQLRQKISTSRLRLAESGRELGELTISLGVACATDGDGPESLLRRADDGLLQAKREGRDRVIGVPADSEEGSGFTAV